MAEPQRREDFAGLLPPIFKEGLVAYGTGEGRAGRPAALDRAALRALTSTERDAYDEARKDWHAAFGPYRTQHARDCVDEIEEFVDSNRQPADRVRPSVALDGLAGTGKTTMLHRFASDYHRAQTTRHGPTTPAGNERLPVCVTTLDGAASRLGLNKAILEFYGYPYPLKGPASDLSRYVHAAVLGCATKVIVVDDVHFLQPTTKDGRDVSDHLKNLSTRLNVTFVFGGQELHERALLSEGKEQNNRRGSTARRWTRIEVEPLKEPAAKPSKDDQWTQLLLAFEKDIVLARAYPGMLYKDCRDVLWTRTQGNLATLNALLVRACRRAVTNRTERLDSEMLRSMRLDSAAQRLSELNGGTPPTPGTGSAAVADVA